MTSDNRNLLHEYRSMLKGTELEEGVDLFLFRPLAFLLVKILQHTRVTPNQVTLFSLVPGMAAGWCYWQGTPDFFLAGALLLFLTNVLDCVDGMLARVRGTGSLVGYVLDGLVDYLTQIYLVIGVIHGLGVLTGEPMFVMAIGIPAGLSFAWWSAMLDRIRNEWLDRVYGKRRDPAIELQELGAQAEKWRAEGSHRGERALVAIYGGYARFWYSGPVHRKVVDRDRVPLEIWMRARRPVLAMAVLMGPSMHLFLIMLGGVFNRLDWYLWTALVFGTTWGLVTLALRAMIDRNLAAAITGGAHD